MRVRAENRRKLIAAVILALVALVMMARRIAGSDVPPVPAAMVGHGDGSKTKASVRRNPRDLTAFDPRLRSDRLQLSEDSEYTGTGRNIFEIESPSVRTVTHREPDPPPPPPPSKPSPPLFHLNFFGFASAPGGAKRVFLSKDGDVFMGRQGDIINRRYRILRVTPTSVEMEDLLDDVRQRVLLNE